MSTTRTPSQQITEVVTSWPGVEVTPGNFGATAFVLGRREIGHLHGDRAAHFAFPKQVRADLLERGRVEPHPVDSPGLAARPIRDDADVLDVIELLRLNYDRIVARHGLAGKPSKAT